MATLKLSNKAQDQRARRDPFRKPVRAATAPRVHMGQGPKPPAPPPAPSRPRPLPIEESSAPVHAHRVHSLAPQEAERTQGIQGAGVTQVVKVRHVAAITQSATHAVANPGSERVSKRMADMGLASRREADAWIEAGWVKVNGVLATLGQRVDSQARIDIDPRARQDQRQRITVLYHKPLGIVSGQAEDDHVPAVAMINASTRWSACRVDLGFHAAMREGLAPAGRLDLDSSGLLVLTQDGRIARQLIGEDSDVEKEYEVHVDTRDRWSLGEVALGKLRHGLTLDEVRLRPAQVDRMDIDDGRQLHGVLRFVLREGRKRQIRRMCEAVGLRVTQLERTRVGRIALGGLPLGQWRFLNHDESFV
jgi:23S rRNA pseudouridine2604 synthase